ncbi:MAG: hypothetical protein WC782_13905 [Methylococcaceae bacterium]|jgi:hypothetical protein
MALLKKWIGHIEAWQASDLAQADYCWQQQLTQKPLVHVCVNIAGGNPTTGIG